MPGAVFLEGDEINLRTIEEEDLEFIRDTYNHPDIRDQMSHREPVNLQQQERGFFENVICADEEVNLAISRDEEMIGMINLSPTKQEGVVEIGLWIHPNHQGNGYGKEASRKVIDYAFDELRNHKIVAKVSAANSGSMKLWEKLGFEHEGTLKEEFYSSGEYRDIEYFGLLEDQWRSD